MGKLIANTDKPGKRSPKKFGDPVNDPKKNQQDPLLKQSIKWAEENRERSEKTRNNIAEELRRLQLLQSSMRKK